MTRRALVAFAVPAAVAAVALLVDRPVAALVAGLAAIVGAVLRLVAPAAVAHVDRAFAGVTRALGHALGLVVVSVLAVVVVVPAWVVSGAARRVHLAPPTTHGWQRLSDDSPV